MTNKERVKYELHQAAERVGGWVELAERLNTTYQTVNRWSKRAPQQFEQYENILRINKSRQHVDALREAKEQIERLLKRAAHQGYPNLRPYQNALVALEKLL